MALTTEQLTIIRSSLDPTNWVQGAAKINQANQQIAQSGAAVASSQTKVTQSLVGSADAAAKFLGRLDPAIGAQQRFGTAADQAARFVQNGRLSHEQASAALTTYAERMNRASASAEGGAHASAGVTRELIVMGHEIVTGNFARLGGSMLVLTERVSTLRDAVRTVGTALIGPLGIGIAGVAAIAGLSIAAETASRHMETLRNGLVGTRSDFATVAPQVRDAAATLSAGSRLDRPEAEQSITAIYNAPIFRGSGDQAVAIGRAFANLNQIMGDAVGDTKRLTEAFADPAKVIQELADRHIRNFDQALVNQAHQLEASGDAASAFTLLLEHMRGATTDVDNSLTPIEKSMRALDETFRKATGSADGFLITIGKLFNRFVAFEIHGAQELIKALPGRSRTPDGGAVGLFQLRTAAAQDVGLSPDQRSDYSSNIIGGLKYFRQQLEANAGDIDRATRGYHRPADVAEGKGYDYLASVQGQHLGALDPKVKGDIETAFTTIFADMIRAGNGAAIRDRIEQIALQESGGHHTTAAGVVTTNPDAPPAATPAATVAPTAAGTPNAQGLANPAEATRNLVESEYAKTIQFQREQLELQIARLRESAAAETTTGEQARHAAADIQELTIKLGGLKDPLTQEQQMAQAATDAAKAFGAQSGAARELLDIQLKYAQISRDTHQPIDQASLATELAAAQQKLAGQFGDTTFQLTRQIAALNAEAPALLESARAAERRVNAERAVDEARRTSVPGTAQNADQVRQRIDLYNRESDAKHNSAAAGEVRGQSNELDTLQAEYRLIGASNAERERTLAILAERQKFDLRPGEQTSSPVEQSAIDSAGRMADYRTTIASAQRSLGELENITTDVLGKTTHALTDPLRQGETALTRFRDSAVSVFETIYQEIIKLAVVNPILNSLFPGEGRPTFGSVLGAAGSIGGGGGAGGAYGGGGGGGGASGGGTGAGGLLNGPGGLLGGIVNKIGGAGFYQGGGLLGSLFSGADVSAATAPLAAGISGPVAATSDFGLSGWLSSIFHEGGLVGAGGPMVFAPASMFAGAERFHSGLNSDEFPAILQRGERVLTAGQNSRVTGALSAAGGTTIHNHTWNVTTPDAASFNRSKGQVQATATQALNRATARKSV